MVVVWLQQQKQTSCRLNQENTPLKCCTPKHLSVCVCVSVRACIWVSLRARCWLGPSVAGQCAGVFHCLLCSLNCSTRPFPALRINKQQSHWLRSDWTSCNELWKAGQQCHSMNTLLRLINTRSQHTWRSCYIHTFIVMSSLHPGRGSKVWAHFYLISLQDAKIICSH